MTLNLEEKIELLRMARAVLEAYLQRREFIPIPPKNAALNQKGGAFVTLESHGDLRGCIGHIAADKPLYLTVQEMAIEAATGDPRFPSVSAEELPHLEIEISALSPIVRLPKERLNEIEIGKHGLIVAHGKRRGLLLPQVAEGEGWDRETFLSATCRKAGLPTDAWKKDDTRIEVFTAEVFSEKDFAE